MAHIMNSDMTAIEISIFLCVFLTSAFASKNGNFPVSETSPNLFRNVNVRENTIVAVSMLGEYGVGTQEFKADRTSTDAFEAEINTLKDRMSIFEKVTYQQDEVFEIPYRNYFKDMQPMCQAGNPHNTGNSSFVYRNRLMDSIKRTLDFVESHLDQLHTIEPSLALVTLKVIDDKHGGELQKEYPLSDWISQICGTFHDERDAHSCNAVTKLWKSPEGNWKPESTIQTFAGEFTTIGSEKEVIWGRLNGECQFALLTRCEVPYVCERTLFDPTPRSQYMLTHQMFQRILAELGTCSAAKDLINPEVNHRLCAKIYKEAQLIHSLKTPEILRDLFAEQIGICEYVGYTNFMRQDWLELILSWQSKSDYGCFVRDKSSRVKFITTDKAVQRLATKSEEMEGLVPDENCLPHFTSVSLMALAAYWDYGMEKCSEN